MKFHGSVLLVWCMAIMHSSEGFEDDFTINQVSRLTKRSTPRGDGHRAQGGLRDASRHGMKDDMICNTYMDEMSHARDCSEIQSLCHDKSLVNGVYTIHPDEYSAPFLVYCDFEDNTGWTVFQRRVDGSVDFQRQWDEYKNGFGFLNSECWLGNEKLSFITAQKTYELKIELTNQNGEPFYAAYSSFRVGHENTHFKLLLGEFSGNATDSLDFHRDSAFTTYDQDNDNSPSVNCASESQHGGGWWFNACDYSNLNGVYGSTTDVNPGAIEWTYLPGGNYGLKSSEMKIRPIA